MTVSIEEALVKSNFYEILNTPYIMKYARNKDDTSQFAIQYNKEISKWELSFPLNNDTFNYKTSFDDYKQLTSYAFDRIHEIKKN